MNISYSGKGAHDENRLPTLAPSVNTTPPPRRCTSLIGLRLSELLLRGEGSHNEERKSDEQEVQR
jgi:hypothetical protein